MIDINTLTPGPGAVVQNGLEPYLVAIISAGGLAIAAAITALATRRRDRPAKVKPQPIVTPTDFSKFSGTQNEFMALIMQDNALIRTELEQVKSELESQVDDLRSQVRELTASLEAERSTGGKFRGAVKRYLEQLAHAWPGPHSMPLPSEEDLAILGDTINVRRRRPPATT